MSISNFTFLFPRNFASKGPCIRFFNTFPFFATPLPSQRRLLRKEPCPPARGESSGSKNRAFSLQGQPIRKKNNKTVTRCRCNRFMLPSRSFKKHFEQKKAKLSWLKSGRESILFFTLRFTFRFLFSWRTFGSVLNETCLNL